MKVLLICTDGFALCEMANYFMTNFKKRELTIFAKSLNENFELDPKTKNEIKRFQKTELQRLGLNDTTVYDLGFALTKEANQELLKMNNVALKFNYNFDFNETSVDECAAMMELYFMRFAKVYFGEIY
ncbi:MAG: hypothetical protein IM600_06705 [Bacteroidetes bacterium]|nr:hypothetical protein [Bacteroidota bacterium]MCA6443099.1 hypothetical protein [Bacteroidota bacterium]